MKDRTINLLLLCLGIFVMVSSITVLMMLDTEPTKVDCFDKYDSKIEGVTCESDGSSPESDMAQILFLVGFLLVVLSIFAFPLTGDEK